MDHHHTETEFLLLVRQHESILHKICFVYTRNHTEKEDLMQEIRPLDLEDIIVFSLFILAGYCISVYFQVKQFRFHTRQLEETLSDLDHGTITMDLLKQQQRRRIRVIMLTSLAIATGVFMLLLLFLKQI